LDGLLRLAAGDGPAALATMRAAGEAADALPVDFGPPAIVKPVHELIGETLLQLGRPAEAKVEFTMALALAPGRARSLIGLVRAAAAVGDRSVAFETYSIL